jgi:hypothetical protein
MVKKAGSKNMASDAPAVKSAHMPWAQTPGMYIAGQSEIDEVDLTAREMESKWGVDRLRLLVGVEMREKFDRQRFLFNKAIWHGDLEDIRQQSKRMIAAWRALDRKATEKGVQGLSPDVWEVALPDGKVAALVRSNDDAGHVVADGRYLVVYTLAEVARLIHALPTVMAIKETFKGATVTKSRVNVADPLNEISAGDFGLDDIMPESIGL